MRSLSFGVVMLALMATLGAAQPLSGDLYTITSAGVLYKTDLSGTTTSIANGPAFTASDGITVSYDNQAILFSSIGNTFTSVAAEIIEYRNGQTTSLLQTVDFNIEEILMTQNGEIVFTGRDRTNVTGLFRWRGGANISTIVTTAQLGASLFSLDGGLDVNVTTGNFILPAGAFNGTQLWDVAEDGSVTSLITRGPNFVTGAYTITQDRRDGAIYRSSNNLTYQYILAGTTTTMTPTGSTTGLPFQNIRMDRASMADTTRILHGIYQTTIPGQRVVVQDPGGSPVITSSVTVGASIGFAQGCVLEGERNVGTAKFGAGTYDVNVNFPGESGVPYVLAVTASGFFPGIRLNGLNVCANPDSLFFATAQDLLRPFWNPGPGVLDVRGNARGSIAIGRDNLGVLVHLIAATYNNGRVRTVSSPVALRL